MTYYNKRYWPCTHLEVPRNFCNTLFFLCLLYLMLQKMLGNFLDFRKCYSKSIQEIVLDRCTTHRQKSCFGPMHWRWAGSKEFMRVSSRITLFLHFQTIFQGKNYGQCVKPIGVAKGRGMIPPPSGTLMGEKLANFRSKISDF